MSSSKEKDNECSCNNKLFIKEIKNIDFLDNLDKEKRYEIWDDNKQTSYLEYIESENRWFFFTKLVEINEDQNGNKSIFMMDIGESNGK